MVYSQLAWWFTLLSHNPFTCWYACLEEQTSKRRGRYLGVVASGSAPLPISPFPLLLSIPLSWSFNRSSNETKCLNSHPLPLTQCPQFVFCTTKTLRGAIHSVSYTLCPRSPHLYTCCAVPGTKSSYAHPHARIGMFSNYPELLQIWHHDPLFRNHLLFLQTNQSR